jgi:hypothetical protein
VLGLLVSGFAAPAPPFLRFLGAFSALVWIPGVVLVRDILGLSPRSVFIRYPLYLFAGASAISAATWPLVFAGADFGTYYAAYLWAVAALLVVAVVVSVRRSGSRPSPPKWGAVTALVVLALVAGWQSGVPGVEQDAFDHIGYIRHIESDDTLAPPGVLAPRLDTGTELPPDPRKGTYHDILAAVSSLSGLDPVAMWRYQAVVLFPLAFFAFIGFCREFVAGGWRLTACVILFALSYGGLGYRYPETVAYGQNLAITWYWVLVPLVLRGVGEHRGREAVVLAIVSAGGVLIHFGVALHVLVMGATVLVLAPLLGVGPSARRRVAVVVAAAVVVGAWKVAWAHGQGNALHLHPQGLLYIGDWYVVSPMEVLRQFGMLFLGGLVLVPVLVIFRHRPDARRLLGFSILPLLICFVPGLSTLAIRGGSYMVSRSLLNVPVFPVIVLTVGAMVHGARSRGVAARALAALALMVWGLVFIAPTLRAVSRTLGAPGEASPPILPSPLAEYARRLPAESVILSDTRTAYALSAITPHRYVAVHGQHGNPLDPDALDRLEAVRDVMSPYAASTRALGACARYGVDFVVCNARSGARAGEFLSTWDSSEFPMTIARLDAFAGRFRRVYEGDDFVVFLHDPVGSGQTYWGAQTPPFLDAAPVAMEDCVVTAPGGAFRITAVGLDTGQALPGERLAVALEYEKGDQEPFGIPFVIHLRLDHDRVGAWTDFPGAKHLRRAYERRRGVTLRYTVAHQPFDGRFGVDLWPIGRPFYESVALDLPATLDPGEYTVRVSIERASLLPNFSLRDLLFNRDRLDGKACATLRVTRQRVRER